MGLKKYFASVLLLLPILSANMALPPWEGFSWDVYPYIAFAATVAIEGAVVYLFFNGNKDRRLLLTVIIATAISWPVGYVLLDMRHHLNEPFLPMAMFELFAFVFEAAAIYTANRKIGWKKSAIISLAANAASFVLGLLVWFLILKFGILRYVF